MKTIETMKNQLKVIIDTTPLLKNLTGIGYITYIYSQGLSKYADISHFYAWFFSNNLRERPLGNMENTISTVKKYIPRPYIVTHLIKTIIFNIGIFIKKPDLIFQPNYNIFKMYKKIPTVIMIHDLSHIRYPEFHPNDRIDYFNKNLSYSIKNCSKIITISKFSKQELISLKMADKEKIEVVYNAVLDDFKPLDKHKNSELFLKKYKLIKKEYILFVGTFEPRKNLPLLLKAYKKYYQENTNPIPLILVGTGGWKNEYFDDILQDILKIPIVQRLGFISDSELKLIYAGAKMFVFPSFYEGFGLPPLEAMASGTAVIASNTSSIPEVVEDAGILIDPLKEDELLEAINLLDKNDEARYEYEKKGIKQAKKFKWDKSIKKLFNIFENIVDDK